MMYLYLVVVVLSYPGKEYKLSVHRHVQPACFEQPWAIWRLDVARAKVEKMKCKPHGYSLEPNNE